jgi:sortase B
MPADNVQDSAVPDLNVDFEALKAINKDAAAWLCSPGTVIDYPVMKADNYSYYLRRLPDGTENANGSLFIDYNNAPDFSEPLTVIYGHHMKSGRMFGSLKGYKDQGYYAKHPYMYLYTEQGNYRIELLYGFVIGAGQWRERAFMYAENVPMLLAYAAHNTTFESKAKYAEGDRVVALSTCSYEFDDARYVVVGVLRRIPAR